MTITLGIPQIIWIVLAVYGLIDETINHGEPQQCLHLRD